MYIQESCGTKQDRLFKVTVSPEQYNTVSTNFTRIIAGQQLHAELTLTLVLTSTGVWLEETSAAHH
jgi:hypothetical protein